MLNNFAHVADVIDESMTEHMTDSNHWLGDGGFTVFWMVVLMIAVILIIVLIIKYVPDNNLKKDPLAIAKERFAKGEIDEKEYKSIEKTLKKS